MKQENNIDQVFQSKLENYAVDPPAHVWDNILGSMVSVRKRRRLAYISRIAAVAAVLLLALVGGWYFTKNTPEVTVLSREERPNKVDLPGKSNGLDVSQIAENQNFKSNDQQIDNGVIAMLPARNYRHMPTISVLSEEHHVALRPIKRKRPLALAFLPAKDPVVYQNRENEKYLTPFNILPKERLTDADRKIMALNVQEKPKTKSTPRTWKLGMLISPGYSSQVSSHSEAYATNMTYSATEGNTNVTGGISVQVQTGKRWSIESGIYYDQNGQKFQRPDQFFAFGKNYEAADFSPLELTKNVVAYSNNVNIDNGNIVLNSMAGAVALDNTPKGVEVNSDLEASDYQSRGTLITSGNFSQVFDFIEVPLYLRYKMIDKRFDVEMLGGINAGMVVGNNAYIDNEYGLQNIGKTQDISTLNISGTVGVGVNYQLGKRFSLSAEPRFSYFLSSINKSPNVNFRPYRIGFYTGVYYQF